MKKLLLILSLVVMAITAIPVQAASNMSDRQVLEYVKKGMASGKSQKDILTELAARGVDRAQAERVKKLYQAEIAKKSDGTNTKGVNRQRGKRLEKDELKNGRLSRTKSDKQKDATQDESFSEEELAMSEDYFTSPLENRDSLLSAEKDSVFGRDIFKNRELSFEPSLTLATPRNYKLGPGDEVIIDIYGANQTTIQDVISSEGSITVDVLGPIYLNGKTIDEANAFLRKKLSTIYAGLEKDEDAKTEIVLSLGETRSITINVLGEVETPGTYTLSGFATAFHALYSAGGVKDPGSIRKIKVTRRGKTISTIDAYDFIMNGNSQSNIRLEDGDAVIVPAYNNLVKVEIIGKVVDEEFAKLLTKNPQFSLSDILLLDKVQKRKVLNDDEIAYLRKKGFIEGRKPNFFLSENVVKPIDNKKLKADYIKNRNFDDSHYKDMILNYIKKYKKASKSDIGNLIVDKLSPVLSDKQKQSKVSNLLSSLRIDGKIECVNRFWVIKKN